MSTNDDAGTSPIEAVADERAARAVASAQETAPPPGDARQAKVVANETLYRDVNEQLEGLAAGDSLTICCECGDLGCALPLEIARSAYDRVRTDPLQFVILLGHEQPAYESIVEITTGYEVVRKYPSSAAQVAQTADRKLDPHADA